VKKILLMLVVLLSGAAQAGLVYCAGEVQRVAIEGGEYTIWIGSSEATSTIHDLGRYDNYLAEKHFSMATTAYATGHNFVIRYNNPPSTSCSNLRRSEAYISYITFNK